MGDTAAPTVGADHGALVYQSPEFIAGVAWAAHIMRHAVGTTHGDYGRLRLPDPSANTCCPRVVIDFVDRLAGQLEATGARVPDHTHR